MKKIFVISFLGLTCGAMIATIAYDHDLKRKVTKVETTEVKEPHDDFMTAQAMPLKADKPVQVAVRNAAVEDIEAEILIEDRLISGLSADKGIRQIAEVSNVECHDLHCTVAVEAKDPESAGVQMAVLKFVQAHPEFGTSFTINESKDDHRVTLFTFSRDKK